MPRQGDGSASTSATAYPGGRHHVDTLPQLLRMEDRSSMAFSLEARVPLLDHRVVEFGVSLPDHLKVNQGWSKFAVREAMAGLVPDSVRLRKTKLGFAAPDRAWLADDLRGPDYGVARGDLRCQAIRRRVCTAALVSWIPRTRREHRIVPRPVQDPFARDVDASVRAIAGSLGMIKRLLDLIVAGLALALTSPLMLVAAIGIRLTSPGPIFYRAKRIGRDLRRSQLDTRAAVDVPRTTTTGWLPRSRIHDV